MDVDLIDDDDGSHLRKVTAGKKGNQTKYGGLLEGGEEEGGGERDLRSGWSIWMAGSPSLGIKTNGASDVEARLVAL